MPGIWTADDNRTREKTLRAYAATFLKEEVQAESLARNLEGFARHQRHLHSLSLDSLTRVAI